MPDTPTPDRTTLRQQLLAHRQTWSTTPEAAQAQIQLQARLLEVLAQLEPMCLGLYWPMQGEFNPRDLALIAAQQWNCRLALPFARRTPVDMHFRAWTGGSPDTVDECKIASTSGKPVEPDVVLVPCVGFTAEGYRLGYGGGYYDRTLPLIPGIKTIGVLFSGQLVDDIHPQAHDVPLDGWITEKGLVL